MTTDNADQSSPEGANLVEGAILAAEKTSDLLLRMEKMLGSTLPDFVATQPLGTAVDGLSGLDKAVTTLEKSLSAVKARLSFAKEVSMPSRMDAEAVKTFNTENFRVTRTARVFASINAEHLDDAYDWLRGHEYGSLIKETVNSSSLSAVAKEMMQEGEELPEEFFKVHMKDGISITKK